MKQKLCFRLTCAVLAAVIAVSAFFVVFASVSANAVDALTEFENGSFDENSETVSQEAETIKSDFVATVGTNFLKASYASPSTGGDGYVKGDYVNLRSGAGTSYSVITCMRENTKFTYVDGKLYNSNWYKIKLTSNSKTGYIHKDYAGVSQTSSGSSSAKASGYVNADYVNLRSGAGTNYSVVTCMRKNTQLTFLSTSLYNSSWYYVQMSDGKKGYIFKTYATISSTSSGSSGSSGSSEKSSGYINSDYVNLRSGAGTNYSVVTCMRKNTAFTLLSTTVYNSNWYYIQLTDGRKGYVSKMYATISSSSSGSSGSDSGSSQKTTGYVNSDYVNLRSGAGTNYSVVTCMRKNTQFTFISTSLYNSSWYYIQLTDGKKGYISSQYATKNPIGSSSDDDDDDDNGSSSSGTITLSDTSETIYVGNKYAVTASGASSVKWSSSNTSVATVDSNGVVTAKASGTANIKAASGSSSATCKITVKNGTSVHISSTSISNMRRGKSVLLRSNTSSVKWKSSNEKIATVNNGIVDTKANGYVTITAYTSSGAATCLINVIGRDNIRFVYASPNSAPKNSNVTFKAITDTDRVDLRFVVSNGSTSYTVYATNKVKDGNNYIWSASKKLSVSGEWTVKAYAKYKDSTQYLTTPINGEGKVFVTASTDKTTTVCAERRASDEVINLIADYEGFLSSVTADSITTDPTLGYGKVVLTNEQFYNNLTKTEAYAYLCQTVNSGGYTTKTNQYLLDNGIKFNQQQFDALVCFTYNVGASAIYNDSDLQSVLLNTSSGSSQIKAGASGYVNASYVNLRSNAGTNYSILTCMDKNTKFTFVDGKVYNSSWYKIKLSNGTVGYIYKSYASVSGGTRDLNNVDMDSYLKYYLQYHHAAGSCYWGLLYRRIDEAEVFFYGDYVRDGQYNKKGFEFNCQVYPSFGIG